MASGRRVVLFSGSYLGSKRRTSFHHLAFAFHRLGWDVTLVTAPISRLSKLRGDYRFEYPVVEEANRLVTVDERLRSYVLMTSWQPGNLHSRLANRLSAPLFRRYADVSLGPLAEVLPAADLIVLENTYVLLFVERLRKLAPHARLVYRAADDPRSIAVHPLLLEAEAEAVAEVDLASVATRQIAEALEPYGEVHVHPQAVDKAAFDRVSSSPYRGDRPVAIFVGVTRRFDHPTLTLAAELAPHVAFHVVGLPSLPAPPNVTFQPELPFEEVTPYLTHATYGLLFFPPGYASLGSGNKVAQYSYRRLPFVAPSHLEAERENACIYERGDEASLAAALAAAERMPHLPSFADGIWSWEELAGVLAGDDSRAAP